MDDDLDFDFDFAPLPKKDGAPNNEPSASTEIDSTPEPEPEVIVPDTIETLLEGWEEQDNAKAAVNRRNEAAQIMGEAEVDLNAALEEAREISRLEAELVKRREAMSAKRFNARQRIREAEGVFESANNEVAMIKENFEIERKREERVAAMSETIKDFAWHAGAPQKNGKIYKAFDYQRFAGQYIADHKKIILADEMGTGKTCSSWVAMDMAGAKRVLYVVPADLAGNVIDEGKMWAPHRIMVNIKGKTKAERQNIIKMANLFAPQFAIVVNYEAWRKDLSLIDDLVECQFDAIFMDEAHNMKNTASNAYNGVKTIVQARNTCGNEECSAPVEYKSKNSECAKCGTHVSYAVSSLKVIVPMTGTPILNDPEDMFSLLHLVDPLQFHTKAAFLRTYAEFNQHTGKYDFAPGGADSLISRLVGKFLRRTLKQVGIHLPAVQTITHTLDLNYQNYPDQRRVVDMLRERATITLSKVDENGKQRSNMFDALSLMTRERQANVFPAGIVIKGDDDTPDFRVGDDVNESIKLDKAVALIKEFSATGQRVAVFSQFTTALAELEMMLTTEGVRSVQFNGNTSQDVKNQVRTNFDAKMGETPKWDAVLAHYKSGGVGLNFTDCTHLIILDQEWNPGKENQALARLSRIGQEKKTFVHMLMVPKGVDTWLRRLISSKADMIGGFNEAQAELQEEYLKHLRNPNEGEDE